MTQPMDAPLDVQIAVPALIPAKQTFYWSIRRELWEHRSIFIAPLAAAALMLFGFLFTLPHLARDVREAAGMDARHQAIQLAMPFTHAGWLLMAVALIVGMVYSLDALHGERRDRSLLFWKSLPVSDLITVLAKATIPLIVLPVLVFVLTLGLQLLMLLLSTIALLAGGMGAATLWTGLPWWQMESVLIYQLLVLALWLAPIYGWLLLVSGWARRTVFLWAVLPPLALCLLEHIALHTNYVCSLLKDRVIGFASQAFNWTLPDGGLIDPHLIPWSQLTPGRFLRTPGLWLGLVVAAALIFAAVRQRRDREPI